MRADGAQARDAESGTAVGKRVDEAGEIIHVEHRRNRRSVAVGVVLELLLVWQLRSRGELVDDGEALELRHTNLTMLEAMEAFVGQSGIAGQVMGGAHARAPVSERPPRQAPLGQCMEMAETLDVSRSGLLFYRTRPRPVAARLWVVYPFAADSPTQPETPARVARVKTTPGGGQLVAVEFQPLPRPTVVPSPPGKRMPPMPRRSSMLLLCRRPFHSMTETLSSESHAQLYAIAHASAVSRPTGSDERTDRNVRSGRSAGVQPCGACSLISRVR